MGVEPWGLYPPEINAGRYITGIGAPTWVASAIKWPFLAAAVAEANAAFALQIGAATGNWMGIASGRLGAVAGPFGAWLANLQQVSLTNAATSIQVLQAYGTGLATMVPLPIIIANRIAARTAQVISVLGAPNTEAIRLEIEYAMYWAHNGIVMSVYDGVVNTATIPKPVPPPPPMVIDPGAGIASHIGETAAVQQANLASTGGRMAQSVVNSGTGMAGQALGGSYAGPGTSDTGIWSSMLGGGTGAGDLGGGLGGSFAEAGGGAGLGGGGGLGGGIGGVPVAAPMSSMVKPGPVGIGAPVDFGGVKNAPTMSRPATPMVPPMHPGTGGGKRGESGEATARPAVIAVQQEFADLFSTEPSQADNTVEGTEVKSA